MAFGLGRIFHALSAGSGPATHDNHDLLDGIGKSTDTLLDTLGDSVGDQTNSTGLAVSNLSDDLGDTVDGVVDDLGLGETGLGDTLDDGVTDLGTSLDHSIVYTGNEVDKILHILGDDAEGLLEDPLNPDNLAQSVDNLVDTAGKTVAESMDSAGLATGLVGDDLGDIAEDALGGLGLEGSGVNELVTDLTGDLDQTLLQGGKDIEEVVDHAGDAVEDLLTGDHGGHHGDHGHDLFLDPLLCGDHDHGHDHGHGLEVDVDVELSVVI